ncbi:lipid kinase, YegS/Rv2252/BmrU family [Lentibacillus halodurans]|uniref:Lipid kinase, YegS/Rv2252/BmrU family n=1 Tax=Lentibacillus halodurans TaxID=237679 RepID=A0A1I0Z9W9_9BACI|nr:diacylglycerol kinase family protein [Lentibacillus halodurans]SFB22202.1 lipid kinase, YegS/Rv2252/BmrU family [Lentibacillus halodurans]
MYYFIVNNTSGGGKASEIWNHTETILQNKNIHYRVFHTQHANHGSTLVRDIIHKEKARAIIAVGGDGTVHEVINGLTGSSIPLGIIPAGSGNDFCRGLGIPMKYNKALDRILQDEPKLMDVGWINGRYFGTVAGIGFDGQVALETNKSSNKKMLNLAKIGRVSYIMNVLKVLFYYQPTNVELQVDSKQTKHKDVWLIAIANLPCYAGGMYICPDARNNDELFDICILKDISRWKLLRLFPSVFKGKHINHPAITITKGKKVTINSNSPITAHSDGEVIGQTPFNIRLEPLTISIL